MLLLCWRWGNLLTFHVCLEQPVPICWCGFAEIPLTRAIGAVAAKFDRIGGIPGSVIGEPDVMYHNLNWESNYGVVVASYVSHATPPLLDVLLTLCLPPFASPRQAFWKHFPDPRVVFGSIMKSSVDHIKVRVSVGMQEGVCKCGPPPSVSG